MTGRPPAALSGTLLGGPDGRSARAAWNSARWTSSAKDERRSRALSRASSRVCSSPSVTASSMKSLLSAMVTRAPWSAYLQAHRHRQGLLSSPRSSCWLPDGRRAYRSGGVPAFRLTTNASRRAVRMINRRDRGPAQRIPGRSARHSASKDTRKTGLRVFALLALAPRLVRGRNGYGEPVRRVQGGTRCSVLSALPRLAMLANPQFLARSVGFVRRFSDGSAAASRPWASGRSVRPPRPTATSPVRRACHGGRRPARLWRSRVPWPHHRGSGLSHADVR